MASGSAFAAGQAPVRSLALKISVISGHTDKSSKILLFLSGSVVEHCVSSAKGCGFDSQGTHVLMKMYNLNAIVSRFG